MRTGGRVITAFVLLFTSLSASPAAHASADEGKPEAPAAAPTASIADKTKGMEKRDGLLPLYVDAKEGKLWIEVPRLGQEMIYQISLPRGIGANDLGLDRGRDLGETRIVRFDRWGNKVLLVQPNLRYRALTDDPDERRSVEESFAESVLWGFKVEAEGDGRVLVDATDFLTGTDLYGIVATLRDGNEGSYRLEASRSAIYPPGVKGFPRNSEIEAILTFTGDKPGDQVKEVAPTPEAITVHARHSFVALPEPGYVPRAADPRAGYFSVEFADYAAPLGQPLEQRLIARHRLRKEDPRAPVSRAVKPIVYYVDRGAPEPVRTALMEGARWWNEAFEAAGYLDAFRVELLPEGADPLDVRYNVIEWVHRATPGWSYGTSVVDPRTGEIIKGLVRLGSLRDRQDVLLAEGLLSPYEHGDEHPAELAAFALARLRQLAAHELGHTLGLRHNFLASAENRASVMDYPYPLARLTPDGRVDLSEAYAAGIGDWDKVAIAYGYQDFPDGTDERAALERLLADARARGLTFLTDGDANPGGVHPQAHRWDNGTDAAAELRRVMEVRRAALNRFGERAIRAGLPLATMEEVLVPVYLHHRYQVEAAAKLVGGQWYTYAMRGDGQQPLLPVAAEAQEDALDALLGALSPEELALPETVLKGLPPRPYTHGRTRALFEGRTGLSFDVLSPATTAAGMVVGLLLQPERATRLVEQHALDSDLPGLDRVIDRLVSAAYDDPGRPEDTYRQEIRRSVQRVVVDKLIDLATTAKTPQVRAIAEYKLAGLRDRLRSGAPNIAEAAQAYLLTSDVTRFLERRWEPQGRPQPPAEPPGPPIGE